MIKIKTSPVKGTVDYLPKEMEIRQQVVNIILDTYKKNGFLLVKTPVLENLELLTKGDSGDNQKLMFKTVKRGAKLDLSKPNLTEADIVEEGLRYDLTVPLSRLYAGNREKLPFPFKSIQIDESFRAENPQKGRDRQFTQCDIDLWGDASELAEIEVLTTVLQAYKNLGLNNLVCKISDRKILTSLIMQSGFKSEDVNSVCITIDKIDKIGLDGVKNELLEKSFDQNIVNNLLSILSDVQTNGIDCLNKYNINNELITRINNIINNVKKFTASDYEIKFDISIVRGQGYYTGTVFEVYKPDSDLRGALGGGGRYDNMLEKFLGQSIPAVGFGLGLVPVLMLVMKNNLLNNKKSKKIALIYDNTFSIEQVMAKKYELMKNYDVSIFAWPKNFNNFVERIKNNNFDGLLKMNKDEIVWF